jgi:TfoX/Sxy family transcriptional regulator of competence genes
VVVDDEHADHGQDIVVRISLMAYDEDLAERIRGLLAGTKGLAEKKMFGGLAFLINGNMAVAASGEGGLLLRVPPEEAEALLDEPHAAPMVMRGKPMQGWMRVDDAGVRTVAQLRPWVELGAGYARSLPKK